MLAGAIAAPLAAAADPAVEAGRFGAWVLSVAQGEPKICYVATQPTAREPAGANRGKVLLYVSAWPKDGVKSEVSVKLGYPVKAATPVTAAIGKDQFTLFPKEERAFVENPTDELKLLEAMKKGSKLVVKATSEKGTATTDTYSLSGLSQALQALATTCP